MDYIFLIVGFFLLIKGADFFVEGSSSIAKIFKVPTVIIGLTIVACGTSLPELAVSFTAALEGANDLAIANVVGSNVFNTLVVIGTCAIIAPIKIPNRVLKKDFPLCIAITVILFIGIGGYEYKKLFDQNNSFTLLRGWGIILLIIFVCFILASIKSALTERGTATIETEEISSVGVSMSLGFIVAGAVSVMLGGNLVVNAASNIGAHFGMSQNLIGLTIVSLGTSLPEFVTSIVAAHKGENDLAMGNVIGSNIFNVLLILGTSATIFPITVTTTAVIDLLLTIIISIVVYVFAKTKKQITQGEGLILIGMYLMFFLYIVQR